MQRSSPLRVCCTAYSAGHRHDGVKGPWAAISEPPPIPFGAPESFLDDVCSLYQHLLSMDTSNRGPAGPDACSEETCADWCREVLEEVGITVRVFDAAPGRRNLVASLGPDDDSALIISAHLDVVPAQAEFWTKPAFQGLQAPDENGVDCFWGRGAIDMKHGAAYGLAIMRELARTHGAGGATLKRGLKLVLVADEEAGCTYGSLALVEAHPEWLRGSTVITESGAFTTYVSPTKKVYPIQFAEKGFVWLRLHIRGTPGHGSVPTDEHALAKLVPIMEKLFEKPLFPYHCAECVGTFLNSRADVAGGKTGWILRSATSEKTFDAAVAEMNTGLSRYIHALTHNTAAPTMVSSGEKTNTLPATASLTVDCRIVWDTDVDAFLEDFKRRIPGDYEIEVLRAGPPVQNEYIGSPVWALARDILSVADPVGETYVVPGVIQGFTDARAFAQLGLPTYGFVPVWFPPQIDFGALFHGHDERAPVHGIRWGSAVLRELASRWCVHGVAQHARL